MYASIRQYRTRDNAEVAKRAREGFLPIIREVGSVAAYYMVDAGDGNFFTVTVAEDEAGVEESVSKAAGWVSENLADLIEDGPTVSNGEVVAQS